jgi:hypothetical protein
MNKNFIGIDVSKETLDICVLKRTEVVWECRIKNTRKALVVFGKQLKERKISSENSLLCCEHTGMYTNALTRME